MRNIGATLSALLASSPCQGAPIQFAFQSFAFSTIPGWYYYGESAVRYIGHQSINHIYRTLYIVALFAGSIISLKIIWNIADIMNALMAIPNLVGLLLLSGIAARETNKYLWNERLDKEMENETSK